MQMTTPPMSAEQAIHIDAMRQQIRRIQAALERYEDTGGSEVNWGDVGDLAQASEYLGHALDYLKPRTVYHKDEVDTRDLVGAHVLANWPEST